ncbi:hypothetical protein, partial [uncultured Dialister sp.]|uniref:hypothetical protein n=1 Tax=uncultured Dialister sp. TaxID=278064 RepID=UPI002671D38F
MELSDHSFFYCLRPFWKKTAILTFVQLQFFRGTINKKSRILQSGAVSRYWLASKPTQGERKQCRAPKIYDWENS